MSTKIQIWASDKILRISELANPRVRLCKAPADLLRRIGGGIVTDNQFEIGDSLVEDRLDGLDQMVFSVENQHTGGKLVPVMSVTELILPRARPVTG